MKFDETLYLSQPGRDFPFTHMSISLKITVLRVARYDDLIERYENPIDRPCDMVEGMVFKTDGCTRPEGMCDSAWETMAPFARRLAEGEEGLYDGWMKDPRSLMVSCNDGLRPVTFYIEAVEGDGE